MRVFLTGATGFVGRNVLQWILDNTDARVECLVRDWGKAAKLPDHKRVRVVHGDLLEPESYARYLKDEEIVIHTAALVKLRNGPEFYEANVETTKQLLAVAETAKDLKRFVFVGSISSYERDPNRAAEGPITEESVPFPSTDYGKSKLQAQEMVQASPLPCTVVIPSYIYGPFPRPQSSMDRIIYDVRDGKPYTTLPLPGRATAIYAPDLAEVIWRCATESCTVNHTFFVGNEEPVTVGDAYAEIANALGIEYDQREISAEVMRRLKNYVYAKYPNEAFVQGFTKVNPFMRILFEDYFYASSAKLKRLSGWEPKHSFAEGVRETIAWYRKQGLLSG